MLVCLVLAAGSGANSAVLEGVPAYGPDGPASGSGSTICQELSRASTSGEKPMLGGHLDGVPEYQWWYGCSPTSGGMLVGYWDGRPGFENLYDGDAGVWGGDGDTGTRSMVASTAHITAGAENGYTYGDWQNSASYPNHAADPDCVADFLKTVDGGTWDTDMPAGMEDYVEWDDPGTAVDESYEATAALHNTPTQGGSFTYADLKAEIDADRPMLLNLATIPYANGDSLGHTVVAYGYQDNMFTLQDPATQTQVVCGGFAVRDTWSNGTAQSEWVYFDGVDYWLVPPVIDGDGIEWWPFLEWKGWSWVISETTPLFDWMVFSGVSLDVVPEPATLALLACGGLVVLRRRRR
jgi:hypothetical protein